MALNHTHLLRRKMKNQLHQILPTLLILSLASNLAFATEATSSDKNLLQEPKEWVAPRRKARAKNPVAVSKESIAAGKLLFQNGCVSCHGDAGKGDGAAAAFLTVHPPDLTSAKAAKESDGALYWKISSGRSPMPSFEAIYTPEQRWQIINYVRTLGAKAVAPKPGHLLDSVVDDYLTIRQSLALDNEKASLAAAKTLAQSLANLDLVKLDKLPKNVSKVWTKNKTAIQTAGGALAKVKTLADLRVAFGEFSAKLIPGLTQFGYGGVKAVQVFHCEMALGGKGADWLQKDKSASNPYLGKKESTCGTVQQSIGKVAPPSPSKPITE
jgi:mono/diheme cytochrome c family protein